MKNECKTSTWITSIFNSFHRQDRDTVLLRNIDMFKYLVTMRINIIVIFFHPDKKHATDLDKLHIIRNTIFFPVKSTRCLWRKIGWKRMKLKWHPLSPAVGVPVVMNPDFSSLSESFSGQREDLRWIRHSQSCVCVRVEVHRRIPSSCVHREPCALRTVCWENHQHSTGIQK